MTAERFSYEAADELLRGDGRGDYVGISAIDGLIAAVVAGPAYIEPHGWLPEIFAGQVPVTKMGTPEHRLVQTILHRHDEVTEILAQHPQMYLPMFMRDGDRVITQEWTVGFMLGVGLRAKAWAPVMISDLRSTLAPILSVHPLGRRLMPDLSENELDRIKTTAHDTIAAAVVALYRHCSNDRSASRRLTKLRAGRRKP